eukprot:TRINITY_DN1033_c0_g1_i1.p1 TRINITY_DN1033_c0_g1~~TRINITY_DN1033_c0_g1_i1.p1  ORF type:complete len:366 (-),score=72.18 TRINITY_DN1033_c0_g1_i1:10-1107(-)
MLPIREQKKRNCSEDDTDRVSKIPCQESTYKNKEHYHDVCELEDEITKKNSIIKKLETDLCEANATIVNLTSTVTSLRNQLKSVPNTNIQTSTSTASVTQFPANGSPISKSNKFQEFTKGNAFVVLDTETTGFYAAYNLMTEIAVKEFGANVTPNEFQSLIHVDRAIPSDVQETTGITNEMLRSAAPLSVVMKQFLEFLHKIHKRAKLPICLVGYNITNFDASFLAKSLLFDGKPDQMKSLKSLQDVGVTQILDIAQFGRVVDVFGDKKKRRGIISQSDFYYKLFLEDPGKAHRAMSDVNMLVKILKHKKFGEELHRAFVYKHDPKICKVYLQDIDYVWTNGTVQNLFNHMNSLDASEKTEQGTL